MSPLRFALRFCCLAVVLLGPVAGAARAQDGGDQATPRELKTLLERLQIEIKPNTFALAKQPLQMRTAYAVGGISNCETVLSISNFAEERIEVEVEFFTGFNFLQRGLARLVLQPGETGEVATRDGIPPFVINAVRDSSVAFEGYANIHARTPDIAVHCHMVSNVGREASFQDIKVFRARDGRPRQQGD